MLRDGARRPVGVAGGDRLRERLRGRPRSARGSRPSRAPRGTRRACCSAIVSRSASISSGASALPDARASSTWKPVSSSRKRSRSSTAAIAAASSASPSPARRSAAAARGHRLDRDAQVDEVRQRDLHQQRVDAQQPGEPVLVARGDDRAGVGAAALARGHHPERLQHPQRLAHGRAADLQLAGELALGREPVAGADAAVGDRLLDLHDHVLERAAAGDGLEGAVGDSDTTFLWSDHTILAKLALGARHGCAGAAVGGSPSCPPGAARASLRSSAPGGPAASPHGSSGSRPDTYTTLVDRPGSGTCQTIAWAICSVKGRDLRPRSRAALRSTAAASGGPGSTIAARAHQDHRPIGQTRTTPTNRTYATTRHSPAGTRRTLRVAVAARLCAGPTRSTTCYSRNSAAWTCRTAGS